MEDGQKMRDPQTSKIAMELHLAKFNYYMARQDWKSAVTELQHALNAVIDILDHANKTLKKVVERYQPVKTEAKIEGAVRSEKLSDDMILIEYPGDKIVLKRNTPPTVK
ncbi:MAG: hypothetical protein A2132_01530 [Nitrospirae bacterium RBG_16_43_11]|nr:MAG: hypothetical protein A2132_01530 [Nitrospirae bacterium RBG_16_43_11]